MLPIERILCPTDFSGPSYEAIKAAGELAHHFDAELCVVHVVSPIPVVPDGHETSAFNVSLYERELEAASRRSLQEIMNQMEWKELKVRLIALRGDPAEVIVRTAEEEKVDLIIIATRGRTGLDRLIFGSVAEKVVRLAQCPVLTVPGRGETGEVSVSTTGKEPPEGAPGVERGLDEMKKSLDQTLSKIKEKAEETVLKKKEAYLEKIEEQLREWGIEVGVLKAKAEKSKAEVKMKYLEQIQELKSKQEAVRQRLEELRESGDEAWGDFREGVEKALEDMKEAMRQAASRFKKR